MVVAPKCACYPCTAILAVALLAACGSGTEPADNGDIRFLSCNSSWVAVQDGDGAWTRVLPTGTSDYEFIISSGRGGIAKVQVGDRPSYRRLSIVYGTVPELRSAAAFLGSSDCGSPVPMIGTLVGGAENPTAIDVYIGPWRSVISSNQPDFQAYSTPGLHDLYAVRFESSFRTSTVLKRVGVNVTNGGTLAPLDFTGPEAFSTIASGVTITGSGDTVLVKSSFRGHDGSAFFELNHFISTNGTTSFRYDALPAGRLQPGDVQLVEATNLKLGAGYRQAGIYFTTPGDRTLALGPDLNMPSGSIVASTPNVRFRVQVAAQAEYNRIMTASFEQPQTASTSGPGYVDVSVTAKYLGQTPTTWSIIIPDFSGVAGWDPAWGLTDEGSVYWSLAGQGGAIPLIDATVAAGSATRLASMAPP